MVNEMNGNGYALYNGVMLPQLPEWDKSAYPYAYLASEDVSVIESGAILLSLICTDSELYAYTADGSDWLMSPSGVKKYQFLYCNSQTVLELLGLSSLPLNTWISGGETANEEDGSTGLSLYVWSNTNVTSEDGATIYLASSDPIPLDGMNVIEWDGDTSRTKFNDGIYDFYKVSDTLLTADQLENGFEVVRYGERVITTVVTESSAYSVVGDSESGVIGLAVGSTVFIYVLSDAEFAAGLGAETGTYFAMISESEPMYYIQSFAYPATSDSGDEETHVWEGAGDGFALYNGTYLPNIDSVLTDEVKTQYPYASIASFDGAVFNSAFAGVTAYSFLACTVPVSVETDEEYALFEPGSERPYALYLCVKDKEVASAVGVSANTWVKYSNGTFSESSTGTLFHETLIWSSTDAYLYDAQTEEFGTVYLSASDPIPLDGMQVIRWDGVTDGLTSSGLYYKVSDTILGVSDAVGGTLVLVNDSAPTAVSLTASNVTAKTGYTAIAGTGAISVNDTSADGVPSETGTYFFRGRETTYTSLLAYTPGGSGGEDSGGEEAGGWDYNAFAQGFLVGRALRRFL